MTAVAWSRVAVVVMVTVVLQEAVLNGVVIGGAHPDAFVALAVAAGLTSGPQRGAVIAFGIGLVADLFVLTPFGLSALVYVIVAFGAGATASLGSGRAPYGFSMVVALAAGIAATLLFELIETLIDQPQLPSAELAAVAAVVGVANLVLIVPAKAALARAVRSRPARELAGVSGGSALR